MENNGGPPAKKWWLENNDGSQERSATPSHSGNPLTAQFLRPRLSAHGQSSFQPVRR